MSQMKTLLGEYPFIPQCYGAVFNRPEEECDRCPFLNWCEADRDEQVDEEARRYWHGVVSSQGVHRRLHDGA